MQLNLEHESTIGPDSYTSCLIWTLLREISRITTTSRSGSRYTLFADRRTTKVLKFLWIKLGTSIVLRTCNLLYYRHVKCNVEAKLITRLNLYEQMWLVAPVRKRAWDILIAGQTPYPPGYHNCAVNDLKVTLTSPRRSPVNKISIYSVSDSDKLTGQWRRCWAQTLHTVTT